MRSLPAVIICACVCLLGMQLAGVHMHLDGAGFTGAPHGTHVHGSDADPHDHEGDRDVAVAELGAVSKILLFLAAFGSILVAVRQASPARLPAPVADVRTGRRGRWRPPLRAPPILSAHPSL